MPMKQPPHPGLSLQENCLKPLKLSVAAASATIGIPPSTLSEIIEARAAITPDIAIRLEKAGWGNTEFWNRRQVAYDTAQTHNQH